MKTFKYKISEGHKNSIVSGVTFMNNVMRHTYALLQKYMADEEMRAIIEEWMNELDKELVRTENRMNRKCKAKEESKNELEFGIFWLWFINHKKYGEMKFFNAP